MQPRLCTMRGDHRQYFLSNSFVKNQRFPFILIRIETKPAEENLRIKKKTQRNLVDTESHWSEPQLNQDNNIWIIRTLLSFCVATNHKWFFWLDYQFLDNLVCLYITRLPNLSFNLYGTTKLFLKLMCMWYTPFHGQKNERKSGLKRI